MVWYPLGMLDGARACRTNARRATGCCELVNYSTHVWSRGHLTCMRLPRFTCTPWHCPWLSPPCSRVPHPPHHTFSWLSSWHGFRPKQTPPSLLSGPDNMHRTHSAVTLPCDTHTHTHFATSFSFHLCFIFIYLSPFLVFSFILPHAHTSLCFRSHVGLLRTAASSESTLFLTNLMASWERISLSLSLSLLLYN